MMLLEGFSTALQPVYLLYALGGVFVGTAVGVLPGIGPAMTVALLMPITYALDPAAALIVFAGIYYGGMYGGSTTSILLNTPGESSSIVTALEGNKMAKAGRGAAALATAAIGSFVAGTIATVLLSFLAPVVAELAVGLGPVDYVALMVVAFLTVGALLGASVLRGLASLALGLFIGMIGIDDSTAQQRFTFDNPTLVDGIDMVLVAVGLFALGEALYVASKLRHGPVEVIPVSKGKNAWLSKEDWKRSWKPWLRGTFIGFPIGTVPAGGADVSTFLSYAAERKLAKGQNRAQFGKGAIEGVAGPEAANNAAAAGVLVPLLTLGIPTTATAAMMLTAFQRYQIQPGPLLFENQGALVWTLIASLYVGNLMLLVLNLPLVGLWVKILQIPRPYLLRGHPGLRGIGRLLGQLRGGRRRDPAGGRYPGLLHAPLWLSRGAHGGGDDPRADVRGAAAALAAAVPERSRGPVLLAVRSGGLRLHGPDLRGLLVAPPPAGIPGGCAGEGRAVRLGRMLS